MCLPLRSAKIKAEQCRQSAGRGYNYEEELYVAVRNPAVSHALHEHLLAVSLLFSLAALFSTLITYYHDHRAACVYRYKNILFSCTGECTTIQW